MNIGKWAVLYTDTRERVDSVWETLEGAINREDFLRRHAADVKDIRMRQVLSWEFTGTRKAT